MADRDKIVEILLEAQQVADVKSMSKCELSKIQIEIIAEHLIGRCVSIPPVKIGQVVYELRRKGKSFSGKKYDNSISTKKLLKYAVARGDELYVSSKPYAKSDYTRLGNTIFLTREEAEKALAERSGNNEST